MIKYAAETHRGSVRKLNEDCYEAAPELGLWLVADGVGGHASGDVASEITRATIKSVYRNTGNLVNAIECAHEAVLGAIARKQGGPNMGSTVVAVELDKRDYQIAWVGDSRAYQWDGTLRLLTTDHSFVEALVAKGVITREEAFKHPKRNIITQSIGVSTERDLKVDVISGTLSKGQKLLLCSDGLNDELNDDAITNILAQYISPKEQVNHLLKGALERGGRDNITIIIIDPDERFAENEAVNDKLTEQSGETGGADYPDLDRHTIVAAQAIDLPPKKLKLTNHLSKIYTSIKNRLR